MKTAEYSIDGIVMREIVDEDVAVYAQDERVLRIGPPLDLYRQKDGRYEVPGYTWVTRDFWTDVVDFQTPLPPLPPNFPVELIVSQLGSTKRWNQLGWAEEVERKMRLNPARGVTWHVVGLTGGDLVGFDTVLGEERLVVWSWADRYVLYPALRWVAGALNFARKIFGRKALTAV